MLLEKGLNMQATLLKSSALGLVMAKRSPPVISPVEEPRIILYNVTWEEYDTLGNLFLDQFPAWRMTYLEGTLQIMKTSAKHEQLKTMIGRLVEAYAEGRDLNLNGYGNTIFRKQAKQRGLEFDECYCLGELREVPDIAIEVVIISGGIDKLEVYRGLEVPEVWFWQANQFLVYVLQDSHYELVPRSVLLPELDLILLANYVNCSNQTQAVKAYRAALGQIS
jgi:Uma2 family endonuclease